MSWFSGFREWALHVHYSLSLSNLSCDVLLLSENGHYLFMWIGHSISPEWVQSVFGVPSAAQIDIDKVRDNALKCY